MTRAAALLLALLGACAPQEASVEEQTEAALPDTLPLTGVESDLPRGVPMPPEGAPTPPESGTTPPQPH